MSIQELCTVRDNRQLTGSVFALTLEAPRISSAAAPGQFVHIACGEARLLRRPISICQAHDGLLKLVFAAKGEGTQWLSRCSAGDVVDVLGPLGHGFDLSALGDRPVFIGGGIGVPPMLQTMQAARAAGAQPTAILGFRSRDAVILEDDFRAAGTVYIATDDGSYGIHGFVSDVLRAHIGAFTSVCCCGPKPMLRALAEIAQAAGIPCQVSMEERMGCGIGACLVCACALKAEDGAVRYGHVCKDGPVFYAEEVQW
ncbi:MAG TPA: dihydroorotate dehydrogenase electron transfer subunit [Clostridiales bacterium]|nr:dihydroorotate dehydrogenase electron transfer subunit [Clostridiales bacterium]